MGIKIPICKDIKHKYTYNKKQIHQQACFHLYGNFE